MTLFEVFVIDLTQAYRCRLLHVQYIHFRKSQQILVYYSICYLSPVKVGCSIPGRTVCRPCIAQINISRRHLFLNFLRTPIMAMSIMITRGNIQRGVGRTLLLNLICNVPAHIILKLA